MYCIHLQGSEIEVLIAVSMKRETVISHVEFPFMNPYSMETMVEDTSSEI
jgi:hypothetical protein